MLNYETVVLYGLGTLAIGLILWVQFRGSPASDVDRSDLIEFCNGDVEAEAIVRSVLKNKHLQQIDCVRTHKRIQAIRDAKHAKTVIAEFQAKT